VKVKEEAASIDDEVVAPVEDAAAVLSDAAEAPSEEELDKAAEVAPLVKESCGALDLVKASKHAKTHSPNVEAAFNEDVQPTSSLEDAEGSSGDGDTVITVQPICSFLPAQLTEEVKAEPAAAEAVKEHSDVELSSVVSEPVTEEKETLVVAEDVEAAPMLEFETLVVEEKSLLKEDLSLLPVETQSGSVCDEFNFRAKCASRMGKRDHP
jgi:hypothetical protein